MKTKEILTRTYKFFKTERTKIDIAGLICGLAMFAFDLTFSPNTNALLYIGFVLLIVFAIDIACSQTSATHL